MDPSKINNSGFRQYFPNVLNEFRQKIVYRIHRDKVSEVVGSNCNCRYLNKICNWIMDKLLPSANNALTICTILKKHPILFKNMYIKIFF